jgi:hypothetical protein
MIFFSWVTVAGVTVGDGEAAGVLDDTVAVLPEELEEELPEEPPQPASSTRVPARAQALERRVIDMNAKLSRHWGAWGLTGPPADITVVPLPARHWLNRLGPASRKPENAGAALAG